MSELTTSVASKAAAPAPMADTGVFHRTCECGNHTVAGEICGECKKNDKNSRHRASNQNVAMPAAVDEVLNSPGQPLDPPTRAFFEPRFGHDFSRVRVHTDASAARQLNASAFTSGSDIVFAPGAYRPEIHRGQQLIAHELAHVVQHQTSPVRVGAPLTSKPEHAAERQADSIAQPVALGRRVNRLMPVTPSSVLSLAPETWFRGEAQGVPLAKDGGVVHDLGDGIYFSDRADVAEQYAEMRSPKDPAGRRVLTGQIDPKAMGRVLNLTEEPEFMKDFNFVKARLGKVSGEPYRNMVENHLARKGTKLENFDIIIGPEGVRDGNQMCIRNPAVASKVRAQLTPIKVPGGGRGPGSTGGSGSTGGGGEPEGAGGVRRPVPGAGGAAKAVEQGEIEAEKGAPPRRPRPGPSQSHGPIVSGRQVVKSFALNIGAGIALGIFQSQFKEKVKRDLASLPQPKIDKRGAADFLKDPKVKDSMGLLDLFSKNFKPLGQELGDGQLQLVMETNLELVGLALASEKSIAELEIKLQRLGEIGHQLSEYEELLLTIRDNLEAIFESEDKGRETKKAADELRSFLKSGLVIDWLFHQGISVEEISQMDSNLLHLSVSIDIAFRDAHALKDTVDQLIDDERRLAKGVNDIWWTEFGRQLQMQLKERQRQREQATASSTRKPAPKAGDVKSRADEPQFSNADERGMYYHWRTREGELMQELADIDKKVSGLAGGASSEEFQERRDDLLAELKVIREKLKKFQVKAKP